MPDDAKTQSFRLWAFGDAHVGTDKRFGRSSLAEAISQSEFGGAEGGPPFSWDIAVDVGDMSGAQHSLPDDAEGREVRNQFSAVRAEEHYHRPYEQGTPQGASFLYWVDSKPDSGAFEKFLAARPGRVAMWLAGHTHTNPDDSFGGKTHIERRWGTWFLNVAALSRYHVPLTTLPMSRLLTFNPQNTPDSRDVRVQCYLHTSQYAPQGWYPKAERTLTLNRPFRWR